VVSLKIVSALTLRRVASCFCRLKADAVIVHDAGDFRGQRRDGDTGRHQWIDQRSRYLVGWRAQHHALRDSLAVVQRGRRDFGDQRARYGRRQKPSALVSTLVSPASHTPLSLASRHTLADWYSDAATREAALAPGELAMTGA
jgi:hypothetical protein